MKLQDIYELFIELGKKYDPRGQKSLDAQLLKAKEEYEKLEKKSRAFFDVEALSNPYADTRILYGEKDLEVKRLFAGIDVETAELLLVDRLKEKGEKIDLVLGHHPEGTALASLDVVMHLQAELLANYGVPINVAEGLMAGRIAEISRGVAPINHQRPVDAARLLNLPFMCAHTVADNMVHNFLEQLIEGKKPETVGEIIELLEEVPEYQKAKKLNAGPRIFVGSSDRKAGKIAILGITGGTEGAKEVYEKMAIAGVGTTIDMHMSEEHKKEAEKHHINVVVAGHIASDSIGLNLLLDELEKRGVEALSGSGLIRVSRN